MQANLRPPRRFRHNWAALKRDLPEGEPARELGLDWQLLVELSFQAQLSLGVVLLLTLRGYERVELAPLVVVDEVGGPVVRLEGEYRAQKPVPVTTGLELG